MSDPKKDRRSRGTGSLYSFKVGEEPNQRVVWQASVSRDVVDPLTGQHKRVRITGTGDSDTHAMTRLGRNLAKFESRGAVFRPPRPKVKSTDVSEPTFRDFFYEWHRGIHEDSVSDIVRRKYLRTGELHILPYIGDLPFSSVNRRELETLLWQTLPAVREDGRPLLSPAGRASVYKVLSIVMNRAIVHELITSNPLKGVRKPVAQRKDERISEIQGKSISLLVKMKRQSHPDYCRMLFQYLGLRRAERLGLEWSSITGLTGRNPKNAKIEVRQQLARYASGDGWYLKGKTKTPAGSRKLPLDGPFLTALLDYRDLQDQWKKSGNWNPPAGFEDLIFLRPNGALITLNGDNDDWRRITRELSDGVGWRAHANRRVTASILGSLEPPVPIAVVREILGHSTDAMSYFYMSLSSGSLRTAVGQLGGVIDPERSERGTNTDD